MRRQGQEWLGLGSLASEAEQWEDELAQAVDCDEL